ncbi:NUDIX domain-containing protein [Paenibacillus sp. LMG 31461]|uniref:NUDIX domain-containing protein n=1 Tax=Paenibacillus plantarum TaxID=2654975 RepID=A0ABX1XEW9_9BACL|nr:NUDIX domain-containing protein [Paenibacillus plantarum]NOU67045.1 NUDIX domain-containing protein [Paenibacillus plantarum]
MEKMRLRACALIIKDGAILLIEYENDNDNGVHNNLPAGGVESGATFVEAVVREAKEEACVDVEVYSSPTARSCGSPFVIKGLFN